MKCKVPLNIIFKLRHSDSKNYAQALVSEKTRTQYLEVELPQNFVDILACFDIGSSLITVEVSGMKDIKLKEVK